MATAADLVQILRLRGPLPAGVLQNMLQVSAATLSRLYRSAAESVVRVGRTRAVRYAATRAIESLGRSIPMLLVDEKGEIGSLGTLHPLHGAGTLVEWTSGRITTHPGVPWFLDHARPQGFLGRMFVPQFEELALPPVDRWTPDDTLRALALRGEDTAGAVLVGEVSLRRFFERCAGAAAEARLNDPETRGDQYTELMRATLAGDPPGTSAGGEQPKFTTCVGGEGAACGVIVKFSPRVDSEVGRRWGDLLACEHLALEALRAHGLPAAKSELITAHGAVFLEVLRFDRVALAGRRCVVTLLSIEAEFVGGARTWTDAALALARQKRLSHEDAERIRRLEVFARLIVNTDRHFGNVSLFWRPDDDTFSLAPIYDMLPMGFAPQPAGILARDIARVIPDAQGLSVWDEMRALAFSYWAAVRSSPLLSPEFARDCVPAALAALS